jgi:hypothetical protein
MQPKSSSGGETSREETMRGIADLI